MKKLLFILLLVAFNLSAQEKSDLQKFMPKRFIDKLEVFAGPSVCFNHGNMFVDNYYGEYANGNYIQNKRLMKIAYSVGVGIYHPVNNWMDINLRVLWGQKGYKSKLDHPLNPVNNDDREIENTEYTYNYFTLNLASQIYLDKKKNLSITIGGYFGNINNENGHITYIVQGQVVADESFKGRYVNGFRDDGGVNQSGFSPFLRSFQKYDYGLIMNMSYLFRITDRHNVFIQLADSYGLQNINKQVFGTTLSNPPERNHTLSFLVGYIFNRSI